ncbi:MAG: protein translocase subunit SecF [Coriobacteriales bacterium]
MARYFKHDLNILGCRRIFFTISLILIIISVGAICIRGINLGIEFQGGTNITFNNTGDITIEEMRSAFEEVGVDAATIQTTSSGSSNGFIVRTSETDPNTAASTALKVAENLALPDTSYEVQTIGPDWGASVMQSSLIAFFIAIIAIIIYISIRFEWKMSLTAILGLLHDLTIVVGIYALFGLEVTPNVIAAILTIMGYSLYDTVVSFHRINENASPNMHHSYITIANHSVNQVLARTINTTLTSLIPVLAMLFFGGDTLKDFALAMTIGLVLGSYSSFGISVPIFALWKSRELVYARLAVKYGEGVGDFSDERLTDIDVDTKKTARSDKRSDRPSGERSSGGSY